MVIMIERKLWTSIILFLLMCITIWEIGQTPQPPQEKTMTFYTFNSVNSTTLPITSTKLPPDDYNRLINLTNFQFILIDKNNYNGTKQKSSQEPPFLLILVHSSPTNYAKRKTIRETWGQNRDTIKLVFMLGSVKDDKIMKDVRNEYEIYGDIAQGNFIDTYRNMTYKHVMVFKYFLYHCPQAKHILKTDDDVFVNMPRMLEYLNNHFPLQGANKLLLCNPYKYARAMRSYRSKWRVSFDEYPHKYYPPYCPGWALLYSPDIIYDLYLQVQKSQYFWIDDVLITGILMAELHLNHTRLNKLALNVVTQKKIVNKKYKEGEINCFLYGRQDSTESEIRALWDFVEKTIENKQLLKNNC